MCRPSVAACPRDRPPDEDIGDAGNSVDAGNSSGNSAVQVLDDAAPLGTPIVQNLATRFRLDKIDPKVKPAATPHAVEVERPAEQLGPVSSRRLLLHPAAGSIPAASIPRCPVRSRTG
jgi:hypothetical protein